MSIIYNKIYNYINYCIYGEKVINTDEEEDFIFIETENKKYLISANDLKSVNLIPIKEILPNKSKANKVNTRMLNRKEAENILNVKLKPVIRNKKIIYYSPRHPVLNELHKKFKI